MSLLARVGAGLLDIEDGRALPTSHEYIAHCRDVLAATPDDMTPGEVEECGRDLIAYVLTFQDQGLPMEDAVQAWAEEWMLS
jgi:hypothetical protein